METVFIVKAGQYLGAGLAMGFGAIGAALGEGLTAGYANVSISRRPANSPAFTRNMLVAQAVAETSAIFALMVAILLVFTDLSPRGLCNWAAAIGAGLSIGLGSFGSGLGAGYPGAQAIWGVSRQPETAGTMTTTMLIGQAVCQTPAIFALVIAFILIFKDFTGLPSWPTSAALIGAGLAMGLGAIGSGWGGGHAGGAACEGFARQPRLRGTLMTTMLVGQAVSQTPAIFALVIAFLLIFKDLSGIPAWPYSACLLGAGLAVGFGAIGSGLGNGLNASSACTAISRESGAAKGMLTFMLVGQAVGQTPAIFALLLSLMLVTVGPTEGNLLVTMAMIGAGLSIGLGAIGSGLGNGVNGGSACLGITRSSETSQGMMTFMLVGQAVGQTPVIFSLMVSLMLLFGNYSGVATLPAAIALLSAGISMGFGAIGPGYGNGIVGAAACEALGERPDQAGLLMRTMLIAQAVAQSTAIYALVIAFVLMFVV